MPACPKARATGEHQHQWIGIKSLWVPCLCQPHRDVVVLLGLFGHDPLGLQVLLHADCSHCPPAMFIFNWERFFFHASHFSGQWAGKHKLGDKQHGLLQFCLLKKKKTCRKTNILPEKGQLIPHHLCRLMPPCIPHQSWAGTAGPKPCCEASLVC